MGVMFYKFSQAVLRVFFRTACGIEVHNMDRAPKDGPVIIASNHASHVDPVLLGTFFERPVSFLARRSLFNNPVFSLIIRELFAFPLDRDGDPRDALRAFGSRLDEGWPVVMFPEGTRTRTGMMDDFKPGVGMISVRNNAPVLPIYIWGSYNSWPRSQSLPKLKPFRLYVGEPVYPRKDLPRKERKNEQARVAEEVEQTLRELEQEAWKNEPAPVPLLEMQDNSVDGNAEDSAVNG